MAFPVVRKATMPAAMIDAHMSPAMRFDPDLGWFWKELPGRGSGVNEDGFRSVKRPKRPKPAGVRRVITFGDSQTFGAGVAVDESWPAFAEESLGEGWEVFNAGISGYRTLNIYRLLRTRMEAFEPDVLLIDCMPFDSPREDGDPVGQAYGAWVPWTKSLLWQSRIYWLARIGVEKYGTKRVRWLDGKAVPMNGLGLGNHDLIGEWAAERGIQVVFMDYVVSGMANVDFECMTREGELPPGYARVKTCEIVEKSGRSRRDLFIDRNHLTVDGNRLVGAAVAEVLRTLPGMGSATPMEGATPAVAIPAPE